MEIRQDHPVPLGEKALGRKGTHGPDPLGPEHEVARHRETQGGEGGGPAGHGVPPGEEAVPGPTVLRRSPGCSDRLREGRLCRSGFRAPQGS